MYGTARNVRSYTWLAVALAMLTAAVIAVVVSTPDRARAAKGGTCEGTRSPREGRPSGATRRGPSPWAT